MKTYVIDVTFYIPADDTYELDRVLEETGIKNEYYGGYSIEEIED